MTDFFDWLTATDAGALADRLAEQFRLSQDEMRRTTDALVPAFMLGIQRAMADPAAWGRLMQGFAPLMPMLAGGSATGLPSREAGEAVMRGLFSPDLVPAIARQASLLTGQAPDVIERMMPALGVLTLQSMMQTMSILAARSPASYPTDPAGHALAETMRRSANAIEAFSRPSAASPQIANASAMGSVFADALKGFPWMAPFASAPGTGLPTDPFTFFSTMMAGFAKTATSAPAPKPAEPASANAPASFPFAGMLANMHSVQADYMREMSALFDRHRSDKA